MNRKQLSDTVAEKLGTTKTRGAEIVTSVLDTIADHLHEGEDVRLRGFGAFAITELKARKYYNPQTGDEIQAPDRKVVRLRPYSALDLED